MDIFGLNKKKDPAAELSPAELSERMETLEAQQEVLKEIVSAYKKKLDSLDDQMSQIRKGLSSLSENMKEHDSTGFSKGFEGNCPRCGTGFWVYNLRPFTCINCGARIISKVNDDGDVSLGLYKDK